MDKTVQSTSPDSFLRLFRRRGILLEALRSSFYAAVINEGLRWSAVFSNQRFGTDLPVFSSGPIVLLMFLFIVFRKWSRAYTAAAADAALDFRNRLASFVDFKKRNDISGVLVAAQEREVAAALNGRVPRRVLPIKPLLCAGPPLLLASVIYPDFVMPPPVMMNVQSLPPLERKVAPVDEKGTSAAAREEGGEDRVEEEMQAEAQEDAKTHAPPSNDPAGSITNGPSGKLMSAPGLSASEHPFEKSGPLFSQKVGDALSAVIDPVYSPSQDGDTPAQELPRGIMTYRILPRTASGDGEPGTKSLPEAETNRIVVNFDEIPEKYRSIVRHYFELLAVAEQKSSSENMEKEQL